MAQSQGGWLKKDRDQRLFNFGLILGTCNAYVATTKTKAFYQSDSILSVNSMAQNGILLGIASSVNINDYCALTLSPQLLVGGDRTLSITTIKRRSPLLVGIPSTLLSIPLTVKLISEKIKDKYRIYFATGARIDFDVSSTEKNRSTEKLIKTKSMGFDLEVALGITFYFSFVKFSPELRYTYGLSNLHVPDSQSAYSEILGKMNVRMFTLALYFEN